jgi:hypothetical protein
MCFFLAVSALSLFVIFFRRRAIGAGTGTAGMQQIPTAVKSRARSFLNRQFKTAAGVLGM